MTGAAGGNRALWVAAAAAAVTGVVLLLPSRHSHGPAARPAAEPTHAAQRIAPGAPVAGSGGRPAATVRSSPSPSISPASEPVAPAAEARWRPVATGFARDFADPGTGQADWLARVRRWTTPYLARQYQQTDPHRIPAATLTTIAPVAAGETIVSFIASYDTGLRLACRIELGPTGWKVTSAAPATAGSGS
jgi:hypothetical protein